MVRIHLGLARQVNRVTEELEAEIDSRISRSDLEGSQQILRAIDDVTDVEVRSTECQTSRTEDLKESR